MDGMCVLVDLSSTMLRAATILQIEFENCIWQITTHLLGGDNELTSC